MLLSCGVHAFLLAPAAYLAARQTGAASANRRRWLPPVLLLGMTLAMAAALMLLVMFAAFLAVAYTTGKQDGAVDIARGVWTHARPIVRNRGMIFTLAAMLLATAGTLLVDVYYDRYFGRGDDGAQTSQLQTAWLQQTVGVTLLGVLAWVALSRC